MSSLQALARFHNRDDWQLVKSKNSYEASKYQIELISTQLDRIALQSPKESKEARHFILDPGVTNTNFSAKLLNFFTALAQIAIFYLVCVIGIDADCAYMPSMCRLDF
jgi:3-keto steroid reductase